uniref:uncharacterized protein LOC122601029 n=1 Tax=Erigeron canadensis TaxID=72917 RepID=UPI001CB97D6C|nr:uncharacterized protein LOC122601029 [Erigeron canadensis]
MHGSSFTYVKDNGIKKSKIDRILVSQCFLNDWPSAALTTLPRTLFDHRPLILITTKQDFGPILFRFFNSWLTKLGITEVITSCIESGHFYGKPDQILNAKFKALKSVLKASIHDQKTQENFQSSILNDQLAELDAIIDLREYTEDELSLWVEIKEKLLEFEKAKTQDYHQKSRAKWIKFGDENSSFFHNYINCRIARNRFVGLEINGS